jgi:beta-glucanase (GH16 family)
MLVTIGHSTSRLLRAGSVSSMILAALVVLITAAACGTGPGSPREPVVYTFADDFDGPPGAAPDASKWQFDVGGGGWGNSELQVYTASRDNSFLDGHGHLVIRATRTVERRPGSQDRTVYRSARIKTLDRFAQKYGHWEARLKIDSREGLWPAWWMLGDNHPTVGWPQSGEVDIVEDYGFSAVESSIHTSTNSPVVNSYSGGLANDSEYHTFRMDWSPEEISFSRDGVPYAGIAWAPDEPSVPIDPPRPMFMLLNLAVGGRIGPPPPEATFPVDLVVDYVRVWQ